MRREILIAVLMSVLLVFVAEANEALSREQTLEILSGLSSTHRSEWISVGTVEAVHEEYRAAKMTKKREVAQIIREKVREYIENENKVERADYLVKMKLDAMPFNIRYELLNESSMVSNVTVRTDGKRFYQEISTLSREDSVVPGRRLAGNYMVENFDVDLIGRRVCCWDGQTYTQYSLPVNVAVKNDMSEPSTKYIEALRAGIIPWGKGIYSYENLANKDIVAFAKYVDGVLCVEVTIPHMWYEETVLLDSSKSFAPKARTKLYNSAKVEYSFYEDYVQVGGHWVPRSIVMETYESPEGRLLSQDQWTYEVIDDALPPEDAYQASLEEDATVEHFGVVPGESLIYKNFDQVNVQALVAEKKEFAHTAGQNCGTAVLARAARKLGVPIDRSELSSLVDADQMTSLSQMKSFLEGKGLYCATVAADLETLKSLPGVQVILHFSDKDHFVLLEGFDGDRVRIVDMTRRRFIYELDSGVIDMDWSQGVALLVSNSPIAVPQDMLLPATVSGEIRGGEGYSCTKQLQPCMVFACSTPYQGDCGGYYTEYYLRMGCEEAASGSCTAELMPRAFRGACIIDPNTLMCVVPSGKVYYMLACE